MRIERVEVVPYALPFRAPYVTARGRLDQREMALLRLHTDAGAVGLGEAVPLTLRGGHDLGKVTRALSEAATRLTGLDTGLGGEAAIDVAIATFLELARPKRLPAPAAAALEMALFDLAAKSEGISLSELLGGPAEGAVRCNATLSVGSPAEVAREAERWAQAGFEAFKLKLGAGEDAEVVRAVRSALGAEARIRIDANEAFSVAEAASLLGEIAPFGIELAEQPVRGLRGLARLSRRTEVPLAADEAVSSLPDAHRAARREACRFVTAKLSKVGGIGAARAIAGVLPTYLSSALDGPVGIAAAAHAARALPDPGVAHGLATQRLFAATIARRECELSGSHLTPPPGPGLGVEIDQAALERLRIG